MPRMPKQPSARSPAEAHWRKSRISSIRKITAVEISDQYRLTPPEYVHIKVQKQHIIDHIDGEDRVVEKIVYKELEIEHTAWCIHGSLEKFETFLQQQYDKQNSSSLPFQQPFSYNIGLIYPGISHAPPPDSRSQVNRWNREPELLDLKQRFPGYLWKAFNKAINDEDPNKRLTDSARAKLLKEALQTRVSMYPEQPMHQLPASPLVTALRNVIALAPFAQDEESPYLHTNRDDGGSTWSSEYNDMLFQAHGVGEQGWRTIRWEVYDKTSFRSSNDSLSDLEHSYRIVLKGLLTK
ncbi:hypothetical protein C8J56DRAFT_943817 [Mycena floridula]|nr:hypothetical protein C8J56DRAFT_943817 [Mycena floridula]